MRLQAVLGGNESPGADDIKSILSSGRGVVLEVSRRSCDVAKLIHGHCQYSLD